MKTNDAWVPSSHPTIVTIFMIISSIFDEITNNDDHDYVDQARALRALGLLLADGTPTVGGGKTF